MLPYVTSNKDIYKYRKACRNYKNDKGKDDQTYTNN